MLLMGKSTMSMAIFNSFLYVYQRISLDSSPFGFYDFTMSFQWFRVYTEMGIDSGAYRSHTGHIQVTEIISVHIRFGCII